MSMRWLGPILALLTILTAGRAATAQPSAGTGRTIVELAAPAEGLLSRAQSATYRAVARQVVARLGIAGAKVDQLATLPYLIVDAPYETIAARVAGTPGVRAVYREGASVAFLEQSLALIGQPDAVRNGATGAGRTVAVLDTGADYHVADLGACAAPGPQCRVVEAFDAAPDDGVADGTSRHGTNVAAIVARVAPAARIVAIDVFDGEEARDGDVLNALDWVAQNRARLNIAAVNLSFGKKDSHSLSCPAIVFDSAFRLLDSAGVAIVAAAGNDGVKTGLSEPACHPAAHAVGATTDARFGPITWASCVDAALATDSVPCFSNSAPTLALLAPGHAITAGGTTQSGTSQATPHVAGAIAALMSTDPAMTAREAMSRLALTGRPVLDPANGLTKPRLDLGHATNRPPAAVSDRGRIVAGGGGAFDVLANDMDEDAASLQLTGALAPDGCRALVVERLLYALCDADATGEKRFRYSVSDRYGDTGAGELTVEVVASTGLPDRLISSARGRHTRTIDANGSPALVWIERGATPRVMIEWLGTDGSPSGNRFEVSRGRAGVADSAFAAAGDGRHYAIAWTEAGSGKPAIVAAHFDGPVLGKPYTASFDFPGSPDRPFLAMAGRTVVGWQENWNPTRLLAAAFDNNSMPTPVGGVQTLAGYGAPSRIETLPVNATDYLLIRMDDSGRGISAYRFDTAGRNIWGSARPLRDEGSEVINDFGVAPLADGSFAIAWSETRQLLRSAIWYARIDGEGRFVQPPMIVKDRIALRGEVAVTPAAGGGARIAWTERERNFGAILSTAVDAAGTAAPIQIDYWTKDVAAAAPVAIDAFGLAGGRYQLSWTNPAGELHALVRSPLP